MAYLKGGEVVLVSIWANQILISYLIQCWSQKRREELLWDFFISPQKFISHLWYSGEVEIWMALKYLRMKSKLVDHGSPAIFVCYADDHASDVFKMCKSVTSKITTARDMWFLENIQWMGSWIVVWTTQFNAFEKFQKALELDVNCTGQQETAQAK